ncbi:MAG: hypothetical protein V9G29_11655 [Burkholderiaceae bacterium]
MSATPAFRHPRPRSQRGVTLVEALLSFLVIALGVLSMSRLHHHLQAHADLARQRSQALRLAQEDIETVRVYASLMQPAGAPPAASSYERIEPVASALDQLGGLQLNTAYRLTRQIDAGSALRMKHATVGVAWTARDGTEHRAEVSTIIAGQHPALSGALALGPSALTASGGMARSARIPFTAKNLGDGRSVLKPVLAGSTAFVLDNLSGEVTQQCSEVPAGLSDGDLTAEHLTHCSEARGLLLSGTVRFSNANPPDPLAANDPPLELAMGVALASAVAAADPWCGTEAQKTVLYRSGDGVHRVTVPLAAEPARVGVAAWTDLGERFVAYNCLVPAAGDPPRWSGTSTLIPFGWTIGTTAADRRICRYAWDHDGSGAIDRNDEHPADYMGVDRALLQQNFLVIRGDLACPDGAAPRMADAVGSPPTSRVATIQHQP